MNEIKFSAERFKDEDGIKVRFAIRGNICAAGIDEELKGAGFILTEDVSNCYYAWAKNPEEAATIQNAVRPLVISGKVSV